MRRSREALLVAALVLSSGCAHVPDDSYMTNHDFFDLDCAGGASPDKRVLHVDIDAHGQFEVSLVKEGRSTPVEARTYTNAVSWTEGGDRWTLDRFEGTLESTSTKEILVCERTGGRRF